MADKPVVYKNAPITSQTGTTINIDFSAELTMDHESETPLLALVSKLKSAKVGTHIYKFAVDRFIPRTGACTTAAAPTAAGVAQSIVLSTTEAKYFNPGDVIEIADGVEDASHVKQCYVTAVSSTTITAYPYDQTYGVVAVTVGSVIRRLFSAMVEGSSGRYSHQTVPTVYPQYIQIFEDYYDVTNVQAENRQYTIPERARLRENTRKKHALDQEYAMWLARGVYDPNNVSGYNRYQMSGIDSQVSSNSFSYGDKLDEDELFNFMTQIHNPAYTGGNKRLVMASGTLLGAVNKLANPSLRITTRESTWGVDISDIQFAGKVWSFVEAPVLSEARDGDGYVIHPMFIRKRVFMPTTYKMNVQNPIDNFFKDGFVTAIAIEQRLEEVSGKISR
jgi:hypothetical protein